MPWRLSLSALQRDTSRRHNPAGRKGSRMKHHSTPWDTVKVRSVVGESVPLVSSCRQQCGQCRRCRCTSQGWPRGWLGPSSPQPPWQRKHKSWAQRKAGREKEPAEKSAYMTGSNMFLIFRHGVRLLGGEFLRSSGKAEEGGQEKKKKKNQWIKEHNAQLLQVHLALISI